MKLKCLLLILLCAVSGWSYITSGSPLFGNGQTYASLAAVCTANNTATLTGNFYPTQGVIRDTETVTSNWAAARNGYNLLVVIPAGDTLYINFAGANGISFEAQNGAPSTFGVSGGGCIKQLTGANGYNLIGGHNISYAVAHTFSVSNITIDMNNLQRRAVGYYGDANVVMNWTNVIATHANMSNENFYLGNEVGVGSKWENLTAYKGSIGYQCQSSTHLSVLNCAANQATTCYANTGSLAAFSHSTSTDATGSAATFRSLTLASQFQDSTNFQPKTGTVTADSGTARTLSSVGRNGTKSPHTSATYTSIGANEFFNPVTVTSVNPTSGVSTGGNIDTAIGTGMIGTCKLYYGTQLATSVAADNSTHVHGAVPAQAAGAYNVTVWNSDSASGTLTNGYTYIALSNPQITSLTDTMARAGYNDTLEGHNFYPTAGFLTYNGGSHLSISYHDSIKVIFTVPSVVAGDHKLTYDNGFGQKDSISLRILVPTITSTSTFSHAAPKVKFPIGTLYSTSISSYDSTRFITWGASGKNTFSTSGGGLNWVAGDSTWRDNLIDTAFGNTQLNNWKIQSSYKFNAAMGSFGVGIRSSSNGIKYGLMGYFSQYPGYANKMYLVQCDSAQTIDSTLASNTSTGITASVGDSIIIYVQRNYDTLVLSVNDLTSAQSQLVSATAFLGGSRTPNLGRFTMYNYAGNIKLLSYTLSSNQWVGRKCVFLGNSIMSGYYADQPDSGFARILRLRYPYSVDVDAGGGNTAANFALVKNDWSLLHNSNVFVMAGINDLIGGTSVATVEGYLATIAGKITANGGTYIPLTVLNAGGTNATIATLNTWIKSNYTNYIDANACNPGMSADSLHPSPAGHLKLANYIDSVSTARGGLLTFNKKLAADTQAVTWTSSDLLTNANASIPVKIKRSVDNGSTWSVVTASTSNTGSYSTTIPAIAPQAKYWILPTDSSTQSFSDVFTIDSGIPPAFTYVPPVQTDTANKAAAAQTVSSTGGAIDSFNQVGQTALPAGLSLNHSTGTITGTPTVASAKAGYGINGINAGGTVTAYDSITVVAGGPTITVQPKDTTSANLSLVGFSCTATGTGNLYYQWQDSTSGGMWQNFIGYTSNTISFISQSSYNGVFFRCVIIDDIGTSYSNAALLVVINSNISQWASTGSQSWSSTLNWDGGHLPLSTDTVIFNNISAVSCTLSTTVNIAEIRILSNYSGNFDNKSDSIIATKNININTNGNLTLSGVIKCAGDTLRLLSSGSKSLSTLKIFPTGVKTCLVLGKSTINYLKFNPGSMYLFDTNDSLSMTAEDSTGLSGALNNMVTWQSRVNGTYYKINLPLITHVNYMNIKDCNNVGSQLDCSLHTNINGGNNVGVKKWGSIIITH